MLKKWIFWSIINIGIFVGSYVDTVEASPVGAADLVNLIERSDVVLVSASQNLTYTTLGGAPLEQSTAAKFLSSGHILFGNFDPYGAVVPSSRLVQALNGNDFGSYSRILFLKNNGNGEIDLTDESVIYLPAGAELEIFKERTSITKVVERLLSVFDSGFQGSASGNENFELAYDFLQPLKIDGKIEAIKRLIASSSSHGKIWLNAILLSDGDYSQIESISRDLVSPDYEQVSPKAIIFLGSNLAKSATKRKLSSTQSGPLLTLSLSSNLIVRRGAVAVMRENLLFFKIEDFQVFLTDPDKVIRYYAASAINRIKGDTDILLEDFEKSH